MLKQTIYGKLSTLYFLPLLINNKFQVEAYNVRHAPSWNAKTYLYYISVQAFRCIFENYLTITLICFPSIIDGKWYILSNLMQSCMTKQWLLLLKSIIKVFKVELSHCYILLLI
jgi:hypothetical protein